MGSGSLMGQTVPQKYTNYVLGDHDLLMKKVSENPKIMDKYIVYEENLKQVIKEMNSGKNPKGVKTDTTINGRRIIPIVFHIIHNYGSENISDAQIIDAVKLLNIDYNKLNTDTTALSTWPAFNSRRANLQIEYRLAKIDPSGKFTDGIQRHSDLRTNYAYYDICSDYAWDPKKYLNIYSVAFIYPAGVNLPEGAAIGGMSVFPPSNPLTSLFTNGDTLADGVLIRHDGIGSIGTATTLMGQPINALNRTFTHELGHYYNLYHPFQNMKLWLGLPMIGSDGCATSGGPFGLVSLSGDEVDDTPPIVAASQNTSLTCFTPGSRNTCSNNVAGYGDELDMVENYMDYQFGYCTNLFTTGQLARINATMMTDRRQLWSLENLNATGVLDTAFHPVSAPKSDFNPDYTMVCAGSSVSFTEFSYNGVPTSWEWSFPGGTPSVSTAMNPTIQYNTAGIYSVQLKVSNSAGVDSFIRSNLIYVSNALPTTDGFVFESMDSTSLAYTDGWVILNQDGLNEWEITDSAAYAGTKSLRIANFYNNTAGSLDEIITPAYDLTKVLPATPVKLKFRLSYAAKKIPNNALAAALYGTNTADTIYDKLSVYYSIDCGTTWVQRYTKSGFGLTTTGLDSTGFKPTNISQWREESVLCPNSVNQQDHVVFKFSFRSSGGNNLYIDNIQVGEPQSGISNEDLNNNIDFMFFPNPMNGSSKLSFNTFRRDDVLVEIYDVLGKNISTLVNEKLPEGNHSYVVTKESIGNAGVYFVKIRVGDNFISRRIVVE
jgi:PKD repeat protein